jgi:hypothetical protein
LLISVPVSVTVRAVTCNNPARYLGTSGVPPGIQELNTAVGQCSGSVVAVQEAVTEAVLVVVLKIVGLRIVLGAS